MVYGKAKAPILKGTSVAELVTFVEALQDYRALGGKQRSDRLIDSCVRDYVDGVLGTDDNDPPVALIKTKTTRRREQDIACVKRLGKAFRPRHEVARLEYFRLNATSFTPSEVVRINKRFQTLLAILQPESSQETLCKTYARCFKQGTGRTMYRIQELIEDSTLSDAMPQVLAISTELRDGEELREAYLGDGQKHPKSIHPTGGHPSGNRREQAATAILIASRCRLRREATRR
ncbi:hypothetical protein J8273_8188 [Carpediemonas membranifera]|uniref:Uncharacterized protein n=1 Tax=Carpediemonas membranifera TaxID=201153 RepID=A0A8J6B089_9EUKA|nr:hypothetical protein J8273_8188 [Carpediemonas membranifera]|eukprot:KAG9390149.1 hypothetical protein J8273_8188 [Carpediemonas membranifera]